MSTSIERVWLRAAGLKHDRQRRAVRGRRQSVRLGPKYVLRGVASLVASKSTRGRRVGNPPQLLSCSDLCIRPGRIPGTHRYPRSGRHRRPRFRVIWST